MPQLDATILSVNVGRRREVEWKGRRVVTGIFKAPVSGPVRAAGVNLDGDDQADRKAHGGPTKSVYAFASEHYPEWRRRFPESEFGWGAFGENLTIEGLLETHVHIGDRFACNGAEFVVTEPRMPCYKLAIRLRSDGVIKHMLETGHTGFYLSIAIEGPVEAGAPFRHIDRPENAAPITDLTTLYSGKSRDPRLIERIRRAPGVPEPWRDWIDRKFERADP